MSVSYASKPRTRRKPFVNSQWRVTSYGVETVRGESLYHFPANRLTELRGDLYDWPLHMAEKNWVDLGAFIEAFTEALHRHAGRYKPALDLRRLKASINAAWRIRREDELAEMRARRVGR
jgi:hypothetical protein